MCRQMYIHIKRLLPELPVSELAINPVASRPKCVCFTRRGTYKTGTAGSCRACRTTCGSGACGVEVLAVPGSRYVPSLSVYGATQASTLATRAAALETARALLARTFSTC